MAGAVAYLDTSAFVKLVVAEPESSALRRAITRWPQRASSTLLRTETIRALRRSGNTGQIPAARRLLRGVSMVRADEPLLDRAADLEPDELRTLDAIHLASALEIGQDLGVMIAYDIRLKAAAQAYGLAVESPS
ncbi:MAG TPA: type II toxin-antitoxin system VapC family toxin [Streptosporangiaceae bacterium]|nr:type II toxin-antitoxin system VapC family toxin [Streptosporangiaceae bacterium]